MSHVRTIPEVLTIWIAKRDYEYGSLVRARPRINTENHRDTICTRLTASAFHCGEVTIPLNRWALQCQLCGRISCIILPVDTLKYSVNFWDRSKGREYTGHYSTIEEAERGIKNNPDDWVECNYERPEGSS